MDLQDSQFTILLAGQLEITGRLKRQVEGSRVIAADGGIVHADRLGLEPEAWLGDFDSSPAELKTRLGHVAQHAFPEDKDATDGELAVEHALAHGARNIVLAGALGGRSDHAFAHLMMLVRFRRRGVRIMATSGVEEAWPLLEGRHEVGVPRGSRVSVLPITDLGGLDLSGVRWPLSKRDVELGSTLTLSNEASADVVRIVLGRGRAVLLVYPAGDAGPL